MEWETVLVSESDGVVTLTMNRPDRMNGMTRLMAREVYSVLQSVAADISVRVLVLTGAGERAFSPGADTRAIVTGELDHEIADPPLLDQLPYRIPVLLHTMPQVSIAAINGSAAGAGLSWACACDLRWASDRARFSTAFLDVGVAGDMCLHWTLPRIVGAGRARELMLFPRKLEAAEAAEVGLVDRLFPAARFRDEVAALVNRLRAAPPLAVRTLKENLVSAERCGIEEFSELETLRHFALLGSADAAEGFAAFAEGRGPDFTGR
jgi:2-(1,2-epoxy-1,2-dihydrophenyl)acetyl-CoA isomerase